MTDETRNTNELANEGQAPAAVTDQTSQVYVAETANATAPPGGGAQDASTQGADKSSVPIWVLVVVVALFLACLCAMMMAGAGAVGILSSQQSDAPDAPVIIVPPTQEQPTQAPPEPEQPPQEQPTQAPPEPEAPQEEPTQAPPEPEPPAGEQQPEQPPSAEQPPAEPDEGSLPCIPLAGGLVLAPLLVIGKKKASSGT